MRELLLLTGLQRFSDHALFALRLFIGIFLMWGVWDNITSAERMQEFVGFLRKFEFPAPEIMARLSVWVQFLIGLSFITGLLTRWAGALCVVHFAIAIVMVDRLAGIRGSFPSGCLVAIGLYLAIHGAGRFGVDTLLGERRMVNSGR